MMREPDRSISLMEDGRDAAWIASACDAIRDIARMRGRGASMTTDAVWTLLDRRNVAPPSEPRAMAAAMRRMQSAGVIETTDRTAASVRPQNHHRPIRLWEVQ